ncbi:uncharacterized protein LOC122059005 [Macadamia integrifolia]|uniref:uncharacterized protein LOC122059005 n=1 Tax=Macadamia integrifolia TaxID=60698 RepID=UPI001C52CA45|nr:uncharacterized protein LOC122059005 [Macadamia integrifolia]
MGRQGTIIWDPGGNFFAAKCKWSLFFSAYATKLEAIRDNLFLAYNLGLQNIIINLDCLSAIGFFNGQAISLDWVAHAIALDIYDFLPSFNSVMFCHIRREENSLADFLASGALKLRLSHVCFSKRLHTRELATQIQDEVIMFGRSSRVSCTCLYGGAPKGPQLRELDRGADIVVATPGRLNDILEMKKIDFRQVSLLVLDEAD